MRGWLFVAFLLVLCVPFCLAPTPCRAVSMDEPSCYPREPEAKKHAPRRRRINAVYKAARAWLKDVIGSLTTGRKSRSRSNLDAETGTVRTDTLIVPTVKLDLRREKVMVGLKMRF